MKYFSTLTLIAFMFFSCSEAPTQQVEKTADKKISSPMAQISNKNKINRDYVPQNMVFAHRGSTYWTPEETEASMRWARNIGADYLEFDLQITKDGYLIALHDDDLSRTSNIAQVFPKRIKSPATEFTLKELRKLDIGSWFNTAHPERARKGYVGSKILTFRDMMKIAEGYRLKKGIDGVPEREIAKGKWTGHYLYEKDPNDNGHRPGLYAETKQPNCEERITIELTEEGWNINSNTKTIATNEDKVNIANTKGRFILQTFDPKSALLLKKLLPNIPKTLLIWQPEMMPDLKANYQKAIDFCLEHNLHFVGSSIAGAPNNYEELNAPWMTDLVQDSGLRIHAYTFDTKDQLEKYGQIVDGIFTNRADLALEYLERKSPISSEKVLDNLGY